MKRIGNSLIYIAIIVLLLGVIFYLLKSKFPIQPRTVTQDSTLVVEKINKVLKLVTVEGHISEIIKHEEFYAYNLFPFRKKALIRANAKVLAGYDLEQLNMQLDEATKTVTIQQWPEPEILSVDTDLEYYDVSEGWFNSFDHKNYTEMQDIARKKIREAAEKSEILEKSSEQMNEFQSILEDMLKGMGRKLRVNPIQSLKVLD